MVSPIKNFFIPTDITDYTESLSRAYTRQKEQDQRDLENKITWSSQKEKADPGVTSLNTIKAVAEFSATAASAAASIKESVEARKEDRKQKYIADTAKIFPGEEYQGILNTTLEDSTKLYLEKRGEISKQKAFQIVWDRDAVPKIKAKEKNPGDNQELINSMKEVSPSRLIAIKEYAAISRANRAQHAYGLNKNSKNPTHKTFEEWYPEYMGAIGLSDGVLATYISPIAEKQRQTRQGVKYANAVVKGDITSNHAFITDLKVGVNSPDPNFLIKSYSRTFKEFKDKFESRGFSSEVAAIKARKDIAGLISTAIWSGEGFTEADLTKLEEGILKGHQAGKGSEKSILGTDLIDHESWTQLRSQIDTANQAIVDKGVAEGKSGVLAVMAGLNNPKAQNSATGQPYTQQDLQNAIQTAIDSGVPENDKTILAAEKYNPEDQTPEQYIKEKAKTDTDWNNSNGKQRKALLKNTNNNELYAERQAEDKKISEFDSKIKLTDGSYASKATSQLQEYLGTGIDLQKGLSPSQGDVVDLLESKFHEIKAEVILNPANDTLSTKDKLKLINDEYETWKLNNGWGLNPGDKGAGILTKTNINQFPGLNIQTNSLAEINRPSSTSVTVGEVNRAFSRYGNLKNVIANGGGVTNSEIAALSLKGNSITGEFEGWTTDLILKGSVLGVSPKKIALAKIQQIIDSGEPQDKYLTEVYKLKDLKKSLENYDDPLEKLQQWVVDNLGIDNVSFHERANAIYKTERIHPVNWTENDVLQFQALEMKIDPTGKLQKTRLEQETKQLKALLKND